MVNKSLSAAWALDSARTVPNADIPLDNSGQSKASSRIVTSPTAEILPEEIELALAYTPQKVFAPLRILFEFDHRLSRIVGKTTEPMLGQMRLAWWREELGKSVAQRPTGDAVLDGLGEYWIGNESSLTAMVDAWEVFVTAESLSIPKAKAFAEGRSKPFEALVTARNADEAAAVANAAARYAIADAAVRLSNDTERDLFIRCGLDRSGPDVRLPRELRGLAVLEALALRSLKRGGRPLMEGRAASLTALRAGIFGR